MICVVGGGVIGSLLAGHLARVTDVSVLCRRTEHARALNEEGLRVTGRNGEFVASVLAATDAADLPEAELVVVATKATELDAAARAIAGRFARATVMTVQNGLGAEDVVREAGAWPLLSAVTFMSGTRHADTHVEYILDTETWIGPCTATFAGAEATAELLRSSGLKARAFDDLRPAQWSKLIFNATVNAVAALTNLPHDGHFAATERPTDLGHLVRGLIDEGREVARAAGIGLHDDPWEMNVLATRRGSAHFPSMLEDVLGGRPTEVDHITGALVREAERLGVPAPLQTAMWRLVKAREESYG